VVILPAVNNTTFITHVDGSHRGRILFTDVGLFSRTISQKTLQLELTNLTQICSTTSPGN